MRKIPSILFKTDDNLVLRVIKPDEDQILTEAAHINNIVWGEGLKSTPEDFISRAKHGWVIGAFKDGLLQGTISGIPGRMSELENMDKSGHPYRSWNGITANGTFKNADPTGDVLFCVAVTSKLTTKYKGFKPPQKDHPYVRLANQIYEKQDITDKEFSAKLKLLARNIIDFYVESNLDYVLRFHKKPKADGIIGGARVVRILENGRPQDHNSLGYNVILLYPQIDQLVLPEIPIVRSIGEALVVAAAYLTYHHEYLKYVAPYSRPAQLRENIIKALCYASGVELERVRPDFEEFTQLVTNNVDKIFQI